MTNRQRLYINYETKRKSLITSLNLYNSHIREELLQYSLDCNDTHKDYVYETLIENYFNVIAEWIKFVKRNKNG